MLCHTVKVKAFIEELFDLYFGGSADAEAVDSMELAYEKSYQRSPHLLLDWLCELRGNRR